MYFKKSEGVTHIWTTRDSEESIIFIKFLMCCYSHYLYGPVFPTAPPPPPQVAKNGVTWHLTLPFRSQTCWNNLKTYTESSFSVNSSDINFSSLGLSWDKKSPLKAAKNYSRRFCQFLRPESFSRTVFLSPRNENSKYAFRIVFACLWTKWQRQMSGNTIFCYLGRGWRCWGKNWSIEVVGITTHLEFNEILISS